MKSTYCTGWCDQRMLGHCGLTVCPPNAYAAPARLDIVSTHEGFALRVAEELLREVAGSGVEVGREWYVTVYMSRETWERVRAYLPGEETKP